MSQVSEKKKFNEKVFFRALFNIHFTIPFLSMVMVNFYVLMANKVGPLGIEMLSGWGCLLAALVGLLFTFPVTLVVNLIWFASWIFMPKFDDLFVKVVTSIVVWTTALIYMKCRYLDSVSLFFIFAIGVFLSIVFVQITFDRKHNDVI